MNAYELLGIGRTASRAELDAAYAARRAAYDPARLAGMGEELIARAETRRAELDAAYWLLRPALAAPPRLTGSAEQRRDRETIAALLVLAALALAMVLLRDVAVPVRTVRADGSDAAALLAKPAPEFDLELLDGGRIRLADLRGKVVLVNLWATWCPACVREAPRLQEVYAAYREQGFVVLGVNTTYQDDRAKVAQFVRERGLTFPIPLDTANVVGPAYGARLLPTSFLIDRSGRIVETQIGEIDAQALGERVAALLKQSSDTRTP